MAVRRLPFALCRPRYASCCTRICAFMQSQTVRPSTLVHPSARPSVRLSSLVSDNRSRTVHPGLLHFFVRPAVRAAEQRSIDSPGYKPASKVYSGRPEYF